MEIIQYNAALAVIWAIRVRSKLQMLVSKIMSISQNLLKTNVQVTSPIVIIYYYCMLSNKAVQQ